MTAPSGPHQPESPLPAPENEQKPPDSEPAERALQPPQPQPPHVTVSPGSRVHVRTLAAQLAASSRCMRQVVGRNQQSCARCDQALLHLGCWPRTSIREFDPLGIAGALVTRRQPPVEIRRRFECAPREGEQPIMRGATAFLSRARGPPIASRCGDLVRWVLTLNFIKVEGLIKLMSAHCKSHLKFH